MYSREKLKDSHPDGKNDTGNDTNEEISLQEKDKLVDDKVSACSCVLTLLLWIQ